MNILYILDFYTPSKWWVERVFENIIKESSKKHNIKILTSRFSKKLSHYEKKWNIEIYRIWKNRFYFTILASFFWLKILKNIDIIHTSTYNSAYVAKFLSFFTKAKIFLTSHEILWKNWFYFKWKFKWFFYKKIEDFIYSFWFTYIFVSNHVKNIALVSYKLNLQNTYTINNPYENIKITKKIRKEELWFNKKDILWVFAWRTGWTKWVWFLLKNFENIKKLNPNFKLLLILLEKNNKKKLSKIIDITNKYKNDIKIIYEIEHDNIYNYLNLADIWIVPSFSEWFGYTALEFSTLKKTLIASNIWWIPEINFWDIHFFTPWNKQEFLNCFKEVFNWKKNNYWYNKLWKNTAKKYLELYEK